MDRDGRRFGIMLKIDYEHRFAEQENEDDDVSFSTSLMFAGENTADERVAPPLM